MSGIATGAALVLMLAAWAALVAWEAREQRRRTLRRRMWQVMDALAEQTRRGGVRRW